MTAPGMMMIDAKIIETARLLDMLAEHTEKLAELFVNKKFDWEYEEEKKLVQKLQFEIDARTKRDSAAHDSTISQAWLY
jgi:hypothetical protein